MSESQTKAGNQDKIKKFKKFEIFKNLNGLSWSSGHAEQLLFSCLGSKVAVYSWKCQWFFLDVIPPSGDIRVHKAGSQLKMSESQTKAGNQKKFENLKIWKFENFEI